MFDTLLQAAKLLLAPVLVPAFLLLGSPVTWLEVAALFLSLAMVGANLRVNAVGWPLAILSSLMYALLFADSKLYGEAGLQFVFVALAGWGWWQWLRGRAPSGGALQVRTLTSRQRTLAAAATLATWPALAMLLTHTTDSDVPWLDALPTTASITGQLLLGRKFVENWAVWLLVNVFSVGLFLYKGLLLTAVLYGVFAALSVLGWRAWAGLADARPAPAALR